MAISEQVCRQVDEPSVRDRAAPAAPAV